MRQLRTRLIVMVFLLVLLVPDTATALISVVAYDNTSSGKAALGSYGYSYVPSNPTITVDGEHVNSLYVDRGGAGTNFAEVGWVAFRVSVLPVAKKHFYATKINGVYSYELLNDASTGNHYYTTQKENGTNFWLFYVDGSLKKRIDFKGYLPSGYCLASSERQYDGDTNEAHFWTLRKMVSNNVWYGWENLLVYLDNDPLWYLRKVSNVEFYVERQ